MNKSEIIVTTPDQLTEVVSNAVAKAMRDFTQGAPAHQTAENYPDVMGFKEARQYLALNGVKMADSGLYQKVSTKSLTASKAGGKLLFYRADLDSFIKSYIVKRPSVADPIRESAKRKV